MNSKKFKIVLIGDRDAGKTTFLTSFFHKYRGPSQNGTLRLVGDDRQTFNTTYDGISALRQGEVFSSTSTKKQLKWKVVLPDFKDEEISLITADTVGQNMSVQTAGDLRAREDMFEKDIRDADLAMFFLESRKVEDGELKCGFDYYELLKICEKKSLPTIVLLTKSDLLKGVAKETQNDARKFVEDNFPELNIGLDTPAIFLSSGAQCSSSSKGREVPIHLDILKTQGLEKVEGILRLLILKKCLSPQSILTNGEKCTTEQWEKLRADIVAKEQRIKQEINSIKKERNPITETVESASLCRDKLKSELLEYGFDKIFKGFAAAVWQALGGRAASNAVKIKTIFSVANKFWGRLLRRDLRVRSALVALEQECISLEKQEKKWNIDRDRRVEEKENERRRVLVDVKRIDDEIEKLVRKLNARLQDYILSKERDITQLRTQFYVYDFFNLPGNNWKHVGDFPEDLRELSNEILRRRDKDFLINGGLFVKNKHINIFKIYDVGKDKYGRPGRWVLLLARTTCKTVPMSIDILKVIRDNHVFKEYGSSVSSDPFLPNQDIDWHLDAPVGETIPDIDSGKAIKTSEIATFSRVMTSPPFVDELKSGMMFLIEGKNGQNIAHIVCQ